MIICCPLGTEQYLTPIAGKVFGVLSFYVSLVACWQTSHPKEYPRSPGKVHSYTVQINSDLGSPVGSRKIRGIPNLLLKFYEDNEVHLTRLGQVKLL